MTTGQIQARARAAYRAVLRELPRRRNTTASSTSSSASSLSPSPLHLRIRTAFRESTSTSTRSERHQQQQQLLIQEAEQLAQYARAQRTYAALLERYNPGMNLDEEERVRLTARRVGLDLPVEATEQPEETVEGGGNGGGGERK